jgi:hypothetical protein
VGATVEAASAAPSMRSASTPAPPATGKTALAAATAIALGIDGRQAGAQTTRHLGRRSGFATLIPSSAPRIARPPAARRLVQDVAQKDIDLRVQGKRQVADLEFQIQALRRTRRARANEQDQAACRKRLEMGDRADSLSASARHHTILRLRSKPGSTAVSQLESKQQPESRLRHARAAPRPAANDQQLRHRSRASARVDHARHRDVLQCQPA